MTDPITVMTVIFLALAGTLLWAALWIRSQLKKAKKQEDRADWTKVREWEDDADKDDDWGEPPKTQ